MENLLGVADAVVTWLAGLSPTLVYLFTAAFAALETTALIGLVVPGDAVILLAGSTVESPQAYALVVLAATGGALIGESGGYLLGRVFGPRLRRSWLGRRLGEDRWIRTERYLAGRGASSLVAVRFVAVVHAVAPLVAGTVRMPYRLFIGWSALGTLIWSATFTGLGVLAGASYREYGHASLIGSVVAASLLGSIVLLGKRRRRSRAATETARDEVSVS